MNEGVKVNDHPDEELYTEMADIWDPKEHEGLDIDDICLIIRSYK